MNHSVFLGVVVCASPSWILLFCYFLFPGITPPDLCGAPRLLGFQSPGITQSSQLHKHRSFHNLFSSARPPSNEKNKTKTRHGIFPRLLSVSRLLVRINQGHFLLESRNIRLAFSPSRPILKLCHSLPPGVRAQTHAHKHTHNSP